MRPRKVHRRQSSIAEPDNVSDLERLSGPRILGAPKTTWRVGICSAGRFGPHHSASIKVPACNAVEIAVPSHLSYRQPVNRHPIPLAWLSRRSLCRGQHTDGSSNRVDANDTRCGYLCCLRCRRDRYRVTRSSGVRTGGPWPSEQWEIIVSRLPPRLLEVLRAHLIPDRQGFFRHRHQPIIAEQLQVGRHVD